MKKAKLTAFCGMTTALSVVMMFITTFVPVAVYILPIVTGLAVYFVYLSAGKKWALGVFFATAFLSLVLLTDKEAALTYTLFFGYYPLLKWKIEKLPKIPAFVVKFVLFNLAAVGIGFLGVYIFGVSGEEYNEFGKVTVPLLLSLADITFLLYDFALSKNKVLSERIALKIKRFINKR